MCLCVCNRMLCVCVCLCMCTRCMVCILFVFWTKGFLRCFADVGLILESLVIIFLAHQVVVKLVPFDVITSKYRTPTFLFVYGGSALLVGIPAIVQAARWVDACDCARLPHSSLLNCCLCHFCAVLCLNCCHCCLQLQLCQPDLHICFGL